MLEGGVRKKESSSNLITYLFPYLKHGEKVIKVTFEIVDSVR